MLISLRPTVSTTSKTHEVSWPDFVTWLRSCAPIAVASKRDLLLFSLTDFGGGTRDNDVAAVYGIALDYDGTRPDEFARAVGASRRLGCGLAYTSFRHGQVVDEKRSDATCRFRVVLPFDRPLRAEEFATRADLETTWRAIWEVVADAIGRFHPTKAPGTSETNIGRWWYVPATSPELARAGASAWFDAWDGVPLSLDVLLEEARERRASTDLQIELDPDDYELEGEWPPGDPSIVGPLLARLRDLVAPLWACDGRQQWALPFVGWLVGQGFARSEVVALIESLRAVRDDGADRYVAMVRRAKPMTGPGPIAELLPMAVPAPAPTAAADVASGILAAGAWLELEAAVRSHPNHPAAAAASAAREAERAEREAAQRAEREAAQLEAVIPRLDTRELVTRDRVVELATRLKRQKAIESQELGRALQAALDGAAFATEEYRERVAMDLARVIAEHFPRCRATDVGEMFVYALERQGAPNVAEFVRMVQREQARRQGLLGAAGAATTTTDAPQAPGVASPIPDDPRADDPFFLPPYSLPYLVHRDGSYWLRAPGSPYYGERLNCETDLQVEVRNTLLTRLAVTDGDGKILPAKDLALGFGQLITDFVTDYTREATEFDPVKRTLYEGLRRRVRVEPRYDERVESFLRELVCRDESARFDLEDWIAACRQDRLCWPAAALIFVGPPNVGKTMVAKTLAYMFGGKGAVAVRFQSLMSGNRFQSELLSQPIALADESFPENLSQAEFSDLVQLRSRLVERKGVDEKVRLEGCARIIVCTNDANRIRFSEGVGAADALQALAERMAWFLIPTEQGPAIRAALDRLRPDPTRSADVDIHAIAEHFAWLQQRTPRPQRFLGARDTSTALVSILQGEVQRFPELFDMIARYLQDPTQFETKYRDGVDLDRYASGAPTQEALQGYALIVADGRLFVRTKCLALALGKPLSRVEGALRTFRLNAHGEPSDVQRIGGARARFWELNVARLTIALGATGDGMSAMRGATMARIAAARAAGASSVGNIPGVTA